MISVFVYANEWLLARALGQYQAKGLVARGTNHVIRGLSGSPGANDAINHTSLVKPAWKPKVGGLGRF